MSKTKFWGKKICHKVLLKGRNNKEMQRQFKKLLHKNPPTQRTFARIRDKFEADRTVYDVDTKHSGGPQRSISPVKEEQLLKTVSKEI